MSGPTESLARERLDRALDSCAADASRGGGTVVVAASGGVDSLTLAFAANARLGASRVTLAHAVSPAVPVEATARTRALADANGWHLVVLDAGEFGDARYLANPVDRCFFCKTNLYGSIAARLPAGSTLLSGTNTDDLGEYRPGLDAARERGVRHPFVEAGIDKMGVRALAAAFGLGDIATLPASPCLSSRVETGIPIEAETLAMIASVERAVRDHLGAGTIRCRVREAGVFVELDADGLERLEREAGRDALSERLAPLTGRATRFVPYRNGSAFIRRVPS